MASRWKYLRSFISEKTEERAASDFSDELKVEYAFGRLVLNTDKVNYAFGSLDKAFRAAFNDLKLAQRDFSRVLLLGLGVGNVPRILTEFGKPFRLTGVELDPRVLELGQKWFGLDQMPEVEPVLGDACAFVHACKEKYDLIVIDLFIHDQVPACAEKPEFLQKLQEILEPGGLLVYNRLIFRGDLEENTLNFAQQMQEILPGAQMLRINVPSNLMLTYEKPNEQT